MPHDNQLVLLGRGPEDCDEPTRLDVVLHNVVLAGSIAGLRELVVALEQIEPLEMPGGARRPRRRVVEDEDEVDHDGQ